MVWSLMFGFITKLTNGLRVENGPGTLADQHAM